MSEGLVPRVVLVRRPTEFELLVDEHGTREQARFVLGGQGRTLDVVEERHRRMHAALEAGRRAIPRSWRSVSIVRDELDRFVFEDRDIIVAIGQDGLVANTAKYLTGQPVIGVNPDPTAYEGILVPHETGALADVLADTQAGRANLQSRTMVEATLDDGQRLLALNELFVGHASHQSARYHFAWNDGDEYQSSSGIIVSTGTGATGWARSINRDRNNVVALPGPEVPALAYFVREAFPGSGYATDTTFGTLDAHTSLAVVSDMNVGGVIFGDGIESDRLSFAWGTSATIGVARQSLRLVA